MQRTLPRPIVLLLCLAWLLASCGGSGGQTSGATIPAAQPPTTAPTTQAPAPTTQASAPTAEPIATVAPATQAAPPPTVTAVAAASDTFVVPAKESEALPPEALPGMTFDKPDVAREVQAFFEQVYAARTIAQGRPTSADMLRRLVDGAYADYTIPLFEREIADANDGQLLAATFSDIGVHLDGWQPAADGLTGTALVSTTRTRTAIRAAGSEAPQTASYQFRVERRRSGANGVAWVATDFLNPATNRWVSQPNVADDPQIDSEIRAFFERFYAARSLQPSGKFDVNTIIELTQLAYQDYTLPLLNKQQEEVDAGKLTSVAFTDLKVDVLDFNPKATDHGGVATVQVTRTARVDRPSGPEAPQTATYRFRLHDHHDETGKTYWLAVDFFQPEAGRWVSEIAGLAVAVPSAGHG
ncbi:MAG TPA: hypothetical protein VFX76_08890 [Roseiflexaceae bacterium]|nr:hypothetical protein [Roseiflexaceae bacterium]